MGALYPQGDPRLVSCQATPNRKLGSPTCPSQPPAYAASHVEPPLTRISHQLTVEARDRPAITSLRLLTVLNVLFKYARIIQETGR